MMRLAKASVTGADLSEQLRALYTLNPGLAIGVAEGIVRSIAAAVKIELEVIFTATQTSVYGRKRNET
jgi:hypothetical protein